MNCFAYILSPHVGKPLYGFGKTLDGFVRISMFKTIPDTVLDVTLQHYLSTAVKGGFCGVDLSQNILAGDILVHHPVNSLNLPDNFFQAAVQVFGIHTLSHINHLHTVKGIYFLYDVTAASPRGLACRFAAAKPALPVSAAAQRHARSAALAAVAAGWRTQTALPFASAHVIPCPRSGMVKLPVKRCGPPKRQIVGHHPVL
jgi:hypothetical protein